MESNSYRNMVKALLSRRISAARKRALKESVDVDAIQFEKNKNWKAVKDTATSETLRRNTVPKITVVKSPFNRLTIVDFSWADYSLQFVGTL